MYSSPRVLKEAGSNTKFQITAVHHPLKHGRSATNGSCWHSLFRNPVIVEGYPILARHTKENGLEISETMMTFLGNVSRAMIFKGVRLLKGFSTLFVPTACTEKSLTWHFLFNSDGTRMSYQKAMDDCKPCEMVNSPSPGNARNFLGWSSNVTQHTGKIVSPRFSN